MPRAGFLALPQINARSAGLGCNPGRIRRERREVLRRPRHRLTLTLNRDGRNLNDLVSEYFTHADSDLAVQHSWVLSSDGFTQFTGDGTECTLYLGDQHMDCFHVIVSEPRAHAFEQEAGI